MHSANPTYPQYHIFQSHQYDRVKEVPLYTQVFTLVVSLLFSLRNNVAEGLELGPRRSRCTRDGARGRLTVKEFVIPMTVRLRKEFSRLACLKWQTIGRYGGGGTGRN